MEREVASDLIGFVSSLQGGDGLRVEETLGEGFVRLRVSEAERRQAKHDIRCVEDAAIELLRNARDAGAKNVFMASFREQNIRTLVVIDDGSGIPQDMHERIFDARVTSKLDSMLMDSWGVHGRGMALYSIRQNAIAARVVCSEVGIGTCIMVSFDTSTIVERADQSTWPSVAMKEGSYEVRGPRNIVRACVEFGLEAKDRCKVYVGLPSEIVATMRTRILPTSSSYQSHAAGLLSQVPLVERPRFGEDARSLREIAASLGLQMSERTAHRIVRGEIVALRNVVLYVLHTSHKASNAAGSTMGERSINISDEDKREFVKNLSDVFEDLARKYYIEPASEPRIKVMKGSVQVTFDYTDDF